MQCKCGHEFVMVDGRKATEDFKRSYTVISNRDYRKFLKLEVKALEADSLENKRAALSKSADYAGFMTACPNCDRLLVWRPDADKMEFYVPEKSTRKTTARKSRSARSR